MKKKLFRKIWMTLMLKPKRWKRKNNNLGLLPRISSDIFQLPLARGSWNISEENLDIIWWSEPMVWEQHRVLPRRFKDVFLETFDALTRLNKIIKEDAEPNQKEPVIDITGKVGQGGTSSRIMTCDQCDYKSSISKNLNDHKKAKQPVDLIPCDLCEFVKKSIYEYDRHVKTMHAVPNNPRCKANSK